MKHWQQYTELERLQLLDITSAEKRLPRLAVEKDWWVTMVLKALSQTTYAQLYSFKGGTSLSKGWGLIERFSEDADIAIKREERFAMSSTSKTQLAQVRRKARHYIIRELPKEIEENLIKLGVTDFSIEPEISRVYGDERRELRADTHPSVLFVHYKSIVPEMSNYLLPRVKIEISCLSMEEPVEIKEIRSFISEVRPDDEDTAVLFRTVIPTRTFLEKIFLLHEEFQKEKPRSHRMSRHLYDLERIMDTRFGEEALSDRSLYDSIVEHRRIFNNMPFVNYDLHDPSTINFIPPENFIEDWKKDYESMSDSFLYHREDKLSFEQLILRMEELTRRIRTLK